MIAVVSVEIQSANPSMPLYPWRAYLNSPSSLRIRNVPRRIGNWNISRVYVSATYPDGSVKAADCVLTGGVYVCTVAGADATGTSRNGYTVYADGTDENGNPVTGYVLGKGDITILESDGTLTPGETLAYVHMLSAEPSAPKDGDLWQTGGSWYIWQDGTAYPIGDDSGLISQLSAEVQNKADASATVLHTIRSQNPEWSCAPSTYDGHAIEIVQDGDDYKPVADGTTIGVALTYSERIVWKSDQWMGDGDLVAVRTDVVGYTLGDQTEKPLQPKGDYALSSDLSATELTPVYGGNGERFSEWVIEGAASDTTLELLNGKWVPTTNNNHVGVGVPKGDVDSTGLVWDGSDSDFLNLTAARTENPVVGYTLGDQAEKPLQPKGDYATTAYAVRNLSGVANVISMPLSSYEAISATADAETLYVITED